MEELYLVGGILLYILTALDIIKTTLSSSGGGFIANKIGKGVWHALFLLSGKKGSSKLLQYAGPSVLVTVLLVWVIGLWGGFFLMLLSDPDSIKESTSPELALPIEKLYYAGFVVSTLGMGDYIATTHTWRMVSNVIAFTGLIFITVSITYFVQVLSATALQNKLATYINGLGRTPQHILINSWNGKDFSALSDKVSDLCQMIIQHTMNHHSYPIIHYYHKINPQQSIIPTMARLYDAYCLLEHAVKEEAKLNELDRSMIDKAFQAYHQTMLTDFIKEPDPDLPTPEQSTEILKQRGIPVIDQQDIRSLSPQCTKQQILYANLLKKEGWSWEQVY